MKDGQIRLKLYNTESRKKEEITPLDGDTIRMYTCGPTVYNYAHIGNFRTYVFEDLLRRCIKFFGQKINHVMNITDVEDKTIRGALAKNISLERYVEPYIEAFFEDLDTLGIERAEHYPRATDYISKMIEIIASLIDKGVAYQGSDGSVFFSINQFPSYGRLSHLHLDDLQAGASERVESDEYDKDNVADFVLWKGHDIERDGQIFWESPFGKGRPGWHIECSAMGIELLGESFDIHVGGVDNMFPHHENEIAQSECYTGKRFVRHWLHSEHLLVDNKKMSKSKGNFFTLRDLLDKGFTGREVRYMLLQTHYRTQLNFTFEGLNGVRKTLERLKDFVFRLNNLPDTPSKVSVDAIVEDASLSFMHALADDLNISAALASLFELVRQVNTLCDNEQISKSEGAKVLEFLKEIDLVLNVIPFESEEAAPQELLDALEKREQARKEKNWADADHYRNAITSAGYTIEDTPQGPRLKKASNP